MNLYFKYNDVYFIGSIRVGKTALMNHLKSILLKINDGCKIFYQNDEDDDMVGYDTIGPTSW